MRDRAHLQKCCRDVRGVWAFVGKYRRARRSGARILQNTGFIPLGGGTLAGEYTKAGVQHGVSAAAGRRGAPLYRAVRRRGSGKSVFAAQRLIVRMMSKPLCNILVVRKVGDTNRTSTSRAAAAGDHTLGLYGLFDVTDLRIVCRATGNECIFKGLDDPEKIKSVTFAKGELTDIWIEEASEIEEADFNQLDIRFTRKRDTWPDHAFL